MKELAQQKAMKYKELSDLFDVILKICNNLATFRKEIKELNPKIHSQRIIQKCKNIENDLSLFDVYNIINNIII